MLTCCIRLVNYIPFSWYCFPKYHEENRQQPFADWLHSQCSNTQPFPLISPLHHLLKSVKMLPALDGVQGYTDVFKVLCATPLSPAACSHASVKAQAAGAFSLIYLICILIAREFGVWGEKVHLSWEDMAKKRKSWMMSSAQ